MLTSFTASAATLSDADTLALIQLYKGCDTTLQSCNKALGDKNTLLDTQKTLLSEQSSEIEKARAPQDRSLEHILCFSAGLVVSGLAFGLIHK